ncbi:MAG: phosphoribosylglycinamide formyltransferase [Flavobacterium sp.]
MKKILVFASGNGSNAQKIFEHFQKNNNIKVAGLFCNNPTAGVIEKASKCNISVILFTKEALQSGDVLRYLNEIQPELIILSGFLLKIPEHIVKSFPNKIVNIHPSLLPKYGGKGMYGMKVHQAVLDNNESETGITIHFVNEHYDEGAILFQAKTNIVDCLTTEAIAAKVQSLEHEYFPQTIENLLS